MVRKELIRRTAAVMRDNDIRKYISIPKQVFHISDDEGNKKDFTVKKTDKAVIFTVEDVEAVLDACQYVIQEALKEGDDISIRGFGTLGKRYRKPRTVKNVADGQQIDLNGHYVPWFFPGNDLRRCLQVYEQTLSDMEINRPPVVPDTDEV